ncbi:GAF and ANTAR domain-containing protein [Paenarthrobacter nicotinovorans]|uniref:GAF and ANTAR domain-containing protein n=1 Tax=Paenarthrobacter nicotinovorans TaxID=29320 RepID=UPI0004B64A53|nr:ANTAR domain-containing protein [Paenarthrobacter nicotinovorans]
MSKLQQTKDQNVSTVIPERGPDLGCTLQDMVLDSPDVGEFLCNFSALAASRFSTPATKVRCGVTVVRRKRGVVAASSEERAKRLDTLQNSIGDGPCLTALRERTVMYVPDTSAETRWPQYMEAVREEGTGSILAVALELAGEAEAVMNLYCDATEGFSEPRILAAGAFAEHGAVSLRLALRIAHLKHARDDLASAMQYRTVIDNAVGIVMAQNHCSRESAFRVIAETSSHRNIKIHDVAAVIVASISGEQNVAAHFED